ncbi:hypothetical protein NM208_g4121 [Fusarium decemcellulare]|uniref:Uncharacterized protein n=1 Tax=Fusarium decemcellulare TaxID=57161 RepID=A0ACC1SLW7_9HYPO|nr:hypothetical protein NM208_g4121 [Fusarium decemcellulare]
MASTWEQTSPNTFEHKRSVFEHLYFLTQGTFGQPTPFVLLSSVRFRHAHDPVHDRVEASLKNAWLQMRAKEPQIVARHGETTKIVEVFEGEDLDKWLSETFIVCRDQSPDDVFKECVARPYMTLFYFPATRELTLQANHSFIDGRGALFFWDTFFSLLENPIEDPVTPEVVKKALPPSCDHILGVAEDSSPEAEELAHEMMDRAITENPIYIPIENPAAPPRGFQRRQIKLTPAASKRVISTCHQKGITVTSAIYVAFCLAVQEYQFEREGKAGDTLVAFTNLDARRYFGEAYAHELRRVACHFSIMPLNLPIDPSTFDKTVGQLSDYYRKALDHPIAEGVLECLPAALPVYLKATAEGAAFTKTPWLTALGIVEDFMGRSFGPWEVKDFWLANTMMSPLVQLLLWTWRGQVVIGGAFNEAFYDGDVVEALLRRSEQILLYSLGL